MGGSFGGVALEDDIFWITQFQAKGLGSAKRGLDGSIAISTLVNPSTATPQIHRFRFTWVTRAQLSSMRTIYLAGSPFTIITASGGQTITGCIPLPFEEGGFKPEPIAGSAPEFYSYDAVNGLPIDRFNGEFTVYATV